MLKSDIKIIQPKFLKKFKCTAGKCKENCCSRWVVFLDKDTYSKYDKIEDKKIRKKIISNIKINEKSLFEEVDYAIIKPHFNFLCPFLNKDNKCSIHASLGEEYLGAICNSYPRYINRIDNSYERTLDCSCIEAARLILSEEKGIDFEESIESIKGNAFVVKEIDTESCKISCESRAYIKEIRAKSVEIIKNRSIDLSRRLVMLGNFLDEARNCICYDYENAGNKISEYHINSKDIIFNRSNENYIKQTEFFIQMVEKLNCFGLFSYSSSKYFKKNIKKAVKSFIKYPHKVIEAYTQCENGIFQTYSYMLENYLVNDMFVNLFPFSNNNVMYNDYLMLIFKYSFIRFYIAGQCLYNGSISKEDVLWSIQSFEKKVGHDTEYLHSVRLYLIENGMDNSKFANSLL